MNHVRMFSIGALTALFLALVTPADAGAQTLRESVQSVAVRTAEQQLPPGLGPLRQGPRSVSSSLKRPRKASAATKASIMGLAAVGGFFGGAFAGAAIENLVAPCRCDDPGLQGLFIGAPIGAVAGGIAGFFLTR